ncbi:class I SAM-dependent methyltransferase [Sanguibacter sp. 25GB23B1]|uniref:class I SAM-dependent methyltransferase n=1 Tax=unclassified Sanguibacter TaxID=2645534 RepID=UPI0032AFF670
MREYWNHNTAFHPLILRHARRARGRALDVGCGDGLLVQRLAAVSDQVTGIEPDPRALAVAQARTAGLTNVSLARSGLLEQHHDGAEFDLVTLVAVLHHMDLRAGLERARSLVAPSGRLVVVGLAANRTALDWFVSGLTIPVARVMGALRHETDPDVVFVDPVESLAEVREVARELMPGVRIRRGLYYRYVLTWTRPGQSRARGEVRALP